MKYIAKVLPMTLEEVRAEIARHVYEEWAYGRPFIGAVRWDLEATLRARLREAAAEEG